MLRYQDFKWHNPAFAIVKKPYLKGFLHLYLYHFCCPFVTLANLDHGIFRHDLTKEGIAGTGFAPMVSDLQNRCGKVISGVQDVRFRGSLSVARKQEGCLPIYHLHHDGGVIGVLIALLRSQDGQRGAA